MSELLSIRSIEATELDDFAAVSGFGDSATRLATWVGERWSDGESRPEWCFVAEREGVSVGRLLYWSFPTSPRELVLAGFWLDWQSDFRDTGTRLLRESVDRMRHEGGKTLSAGVTADPAHFPEKREELFLSLGLPVLQQKRKFHLRNDSAPTGSSSRLTFRSMEDSTEDEFRVMITRVTEATLDRNDRDDRLRLGIDNAAGAYIELLKEVDPDTRLWQIASDESGGSVGLIIPQRLDERRGTLNYVGVIPEARGSGYIDDLLRRGLELLHQTGLHEVVVDVDTLNFPVIAALERSGWSNAGSSWKFDLAGSGIAESSR